MRSAYYDSTYLFKLQCEEAGTAEVRAHAATCHNLVSALHGRAEFISACHRKIREGSGSTNHLRAMMAQIHEETRRGALRWLPLSENVIKRVESFFISAPENTFLRAADALHLACAVEHGFTEIYSNDRHLLASATHFGLSGINIISH